MDDLPDGGWPEEPDLYNRYAHPQWVAAAQGLATLEAAARELPLRRGPVHVVDMACAQGANSLEPMRRAIRVLRKRSPRRSIEVTHTDLPGNDFKPLIELTSGPTGYLAPGIYCSVRAGSFYESMFPPASVDLVWCANATHWLSRQPNPDAHNWVGTLWAYKQQARQDWEQWVEHRARELRRGGQVVMVGSGVDATGRSHAEGLQDLVRHCMQEVLGSGSTERLSMPTYGRTMREWMAPLGRELVVREAFEPPMPDPFWDELTATGDLELYADRVVGFVRASFHQATLRERGLGRPFAEAVRRRVLANPAQARCRWWLAVLRLERV